MKTYKEYVDPYIFSEKFFKASLTEKMKMSFEEIYKIGGVTISDAKRKKVSDFLVKFIAAKSQESVHQMDATNREKRFGTGFLGEAAMEQFLGVDFMDTSIGNSMNYAIADMAPIGVNAGVKTGVYENDKFIAINRSLRHPQVMCFLSPDRKRVIIAGLATVEVLNKYSDDSLIMTRDMAGRKTGFYGFDKLLPFKNLADLRALAPLKS